MQKRRKRTRSIVALTLAVAFVVTQGVIPSPSALADAKGALPEVRLPSQFQLTLPPDLGTIQNLNTGTGPTLIHLQDAHGNYEAQKKIAQILAYLKQNYGIKLLLVEGDAAKLNPANARLFPRHMDITREVLDELAKDAIAQGEELFLLDHPDVEVYGIENLDAYVANGRTFKAVLTEQEKTGGFIRDMDMQIERLTGPYLNKDLRAFLKRLEDFEAKRLPMLDWLSFLKSRARTSLEIDLNDPAYQIDWPTLIRIFKLAEFESKIDMKALVHERQEFLKMIPQSSDVYGQIEHLLTSPISRHQLPDPETSLLFEKMVLSLPQDFDYNIYPNVKMFIGHLILQSEVKGEFLLEEMNRLTDQISEKLAKTDEEKKILALLKDHRLLKRLFALEFSPEDYEKALGRAQDLGPSRIAERFGELNGTKRVRDIEFTHTEAMDSLFEKAMEFYKGVKERDGWMLENIEARLKETGADKAVVITGGFHAEPFKNFFAQKNYNYALIAPKITTTDGREAYIHAALTLSTKKLPKLILEFDMPGGTVNSNLVRLAIMGKTSIATARRQMELSEVVNSEGSRLAGTRIERLANGVNRITFADGLRVEVPTTEAAFQAEVTASILDTSRARILQEPAPVGRAEVRRELAPARDPEIERVKNLALQAPLVEFEEVVKQIAAANRRDLPNILAMLTKIPQDEQPRDYNRKVALVQAQIGPPGPGASAAGFTGYQPSQVQPTAALPTVPPAPPVTAPAAEIARAEPASRASQGLGLGPYEADRRSRAEVRAGISYGQSYGKGDWDFIVNKLYDNLMPQGTVTATVVSILVGKQSYLEAAAPGNPADKIVLKDLPRTKGFDSQGPFEIFVKDGNATIIRRAEVRMLVLSRGPGKSVQVGDDLVVTVRNPLPKDERTVILDVALREQVKTHVLTEPGKSNINITSIPVTISFVRREGNKIRLGFTAPRDVKVLRSELLGRAEVRALSVDEVERLVQESLGNRIRIALEGEDGRGEIVGVIRTIQPFSTGTGEAQLEIGFPEGIKVERNTSATLDRIAASQTPERAEEPLTITVGARSSQGVFSVSSITRAEVRAVAAPKAEIEEEARIAATLGEIGVPEEIEPALVEAGITTPGELRGELKKGPEALAGILSTEERQALLQGLINQVPTYVPVSVIGLSNAVTNILEAEGIETVAELTTEAVPATVKSALEKVGESEIGPEGVEAIRNVLDSFGLELPGGIGGPSVGVGPAAGARSVPAAVSSPVSVVTSVAVTPQASALVRQFFIPLESVPVKLNLRAGVVPPYLSRAEAQELLIKYGGVSRAHPAFAGAAPLQAPELTAAQEIMNAAGPVQVSPTEAYLQSLRKWSEQLTADQRGQVALGTFLMKQLFGNSRTLLFQFQIAEAMKGKDEKAPFVTVGDRQALRSELRKALTNKNNGLNPEERITAQRYAADPELYFEIVEPLPGETYEQTLNRYMEANPRVAVFDSQALEGVLSELVYNADEKLIRKNIDFMPQATAELGRAFSGILGLRDSDAKVEFLKATLIKELGMVVSVVRHGGQTHVVIQSLVQFIETLRNQRFVLIAA